MKNTFHFFNRRTKDYILRPLDINVNVPNVEELKTHIKKHRVAYSFGAGTVVAGFTCLIMKGRHANFLRSLDGSDTITVRPFSFFSKQHVVTVIEREGRGHPGYLVRCKETGEIFTSQASAAEYVGTSARNMSSHLHGIFPDVYGLHFERLAA